MKPENSGHRKRKRLSWFFVLGLTAFLSVMQVYTAENYPDQNSPYFSGKYASENPGPVEALTVVSYNIWFGEDIDRALSELEEIQAQKELDILMLQEMDEAGTERIARELHLNYVYFPAAVEPTYGKNFGNAILSRWPILDAQKLILPHKSLSNRMNRIATRAIIQVHGVDMLVYSLHMESIFALPRFRKDQYATVLDDIDSDARFVIIGGDFNSFTKSDVHKIEEIYQHAGFTRVSEGSGDTIVKYGMGVAADHIFAKGFIVEEAGKLAEATASDHLPIWVTLKWK